MQRPLTGKSALNKLGMAQQVVHGVGLRFAPPDGMLQDVAEWGRCRAPLTRPITEQEKGVCCVWAHNVSAVSGLMTTKRRSRAERCLPERVIHRWYRGHRYVSKKKPYRQSRTDSAWGLTVVPACVARPFQDQESSRDGHYCAENGHNHRNCDEIDHMSARLSSDGN